MNLQAAIQKNQTIRSLANTLEMLELQIHQLPAEIEEKADLAVHTEALRGVVKSISVKSEQAMDEARAAIAALAERRS